MEYKFKKIINGTVIKILPSNEPIEPMQHYVNGGNYIKCYLCELEKKYKRAIARTFGPKPKKNKRG